MAKRRLSKKQRAALARGRRTAGAKRLRQRLIANRRRRIGQVRSANNR